MADDDGPVQVEMGDTDLKIRGNVNQSARPRGSMYVVLAISVLLALIGIMVGLSAWIITSRDLGPLGA